MDSTFLRIDNSLKAQSPEIDILERQRKAGEVMFADMIGMQDVSQTANFQVDTLDEMVGGVKADAAETRKEKPTDAYEKYQYKDKTIRAESKSVSEQDVEKVKEEVTGFSENVTEVIEEELHVTKEEIEAAMEELGLTFLDLLNTGNLANLVAKLSGEENANNLLCSEAFTNILQQVNVLGKEMFSKLQMTPEELAFIQEELNKLSNNEVDVTGQNEEVGEVEESVSAEDAVEAMGNRSETAVVESVTEETADENMMNNSFSKTHMEQNTDDSHAQEGQTFVFDASTNTITIQSDGVEIVQTIPTYVNVSELIEQFVEQTRVHISQDTTKMEMMLNPEHLGKLYLELTEQEGAVTAKIQTQNVVVKEALEAQIAELRQNLSQAGVKVDAIEVTVASHEFERNLEQDANSQKQQEEAQPKVARMRNIDMNDLEGISGLMTEEETIVAKMMAEQGNRVNFTA